MMFDYTVEIIPTSENGRTALYSDGYYLKMEFLKTKTSNIHILKTTGLRRNNEIETWIEVEIELTPEENTINDWVRFIANLLIALARKYNKPIPR